MNCEQSRNLFTGALYGELGGDSGKLFQAHLDSCDTCRGEFLGLRETLSMMDRRTRVEPAPREWKEFGDRLEGAIAPETAQPRRAKSSTRPSILRWVPAYRPAWGYGIAAVFLLAVGFYAGRTLFNGTPPADTRTEMVIPGSGGGNADEAASPAPLTADVANSEALEYLERSRNLLIGVTNLDETQVSSIDMDRQREVSRELYDRGNTLAVALNRPSQQQLRQLVQQLQIILLQLSNSGVGDGRPAVEIVREGIDSGSILLKINVEAIRASLTEGTARTSEKDGNNL